MFMGWGKRSQDSEQAYLTPPAIKDKYADWFDPCPHPRPEGFDGLEVDWGEKAFVNPPWRNIRPWVEKAMAQSKQGCCVHMLLAVVTSTRVFHDLILPNAKIEFIRGDVKYWNVKSGKIAKFPSMFVVFEAQTSPACPDVSA